MFRLNQGYPISIAINNWYWMSTCSASICSYNFLESVRYTLRSKWNLMKHLLSTIKADLKITSEGMKSLCTQCLQIGEDISYNRQQVPMSPSFSSRRLVLSFRSVHKCVNYKMRVRQSYLCERQVVTCGFMKRAEKTSFAGT